MDTKMSIVETAAVSIVSEEWLTIYTMNKDSFSCFERLPIHFIPLFWSQQYNEAEIIMMSSSYKIRHIL